MAAPVGKREVAWRVFAREFNSATTVLPGEDQYAPTYVISPLGALINRVYLTGVLTECENAGTETEPLWRGRVSDPSDVFYISAGQFQPKAARQLGELEVPSLIGIIGKARTYSPDENTLYVSVRVENVKEITQELRDYWVLEACQSLQYRLKAITEASKMEPPNVQELISLGYSRKISMGIVEAINQFGDIDYQPYHDLLSTVLNELTMETSMDVTVEHSQSAKSELIEDIDNILLDSSGEKGKVKSHYNKPNSDSEPQKIDNLTDQSDSNQPDEKSGEVDIEVSENLIFEIINSLTEDNPDGVSYDAVQGMATEHGLDKNIIEECIGSLIDKGVIYEPTIGLFKTV